MLSEQQKEYAASCHYWLLSLRHWLDTGWTFSTPDIWDLQRHRPHQQGILQYAKVRGGMHMNREKEKKNATIQKDRHTSLGVLCVILACWAAAWTITHTHMHDQHTTDRRGNNKRCMTSTSLEAIMRAQWMTRDTIISTIIIIIIIIVIIIVIIISTIIIIGIINDIIIIINNHYSNTAITSSDVTYYLPRQRPVMISA